MKKAWEEAERQAEEAHKVQEEARAKEEAERIAREAAEREEAAKRAAEAVEERANIERRALEERLWEAVGQWSETAVAPPQVAKPSRRMTMGGPSAPGWRCHNKGTLYGLGVAKGETMACKACHHTKASCSWSKKMTRETQKQKQVQWLEETEDMEMIEVGEDNEEVQSHFAVLTHLMEDHWDTLGVLMTMLDTLSMDFLTFWQDLWNLGISMLRVMESIADELQRLNNLKEEMGRTKGKGKEKAKEEGPRRRMEDNDRDMEMGRAGPSSLV
ncbi:hypothetical protein ID866_9837 [Astraeus odoratus]|nr:hypothetical protein ID866_9837 [Astraeus odoratus]